MFVGVNVTPKLCVPAFNTVPNAGLYVNVPAPALPPNNAVAFNCVPLNAVPYVSTDGFAHVNTGVIFGTVTVKVPVLIFPAPSVAVTITVVVPTGNTVPLALE